MKFVVNQLKSGCLTLPVSFLRKREARGLNAYLCAELNTLKDQLGLHANFVEGLENRKHFNLSDTSIIRAKVHTGASVSTDMVMDAVERALMSYKKVWPNFHAELCAANFDYQSFRREFHYSNV